METTRHFTATVYAVNDGAIALHRHGRLGKWLPPGGHVERDELPHEAARREVREELGLDVALHVEDRDEVSSETVRSLPEPRHVLLADVNVHDGRVGHQHVDFVYYGSVASRAIDPAEDEAPASAWEWFTAGDLRASTDRLDTDVVDVGERAIEAARSAADEGGQPES